MLAAEFDHLADAADGQPGFEGLRLIVEARVEDAAIVAGLVAADGALFFTTVISAPGNLWLRRKAVANPTIPPPTINTSLRLRTFSIIGYSSHSCILFEMSVSEIVSRCTGFQWDQQNAVKNWSEAPAYVGPANNGIMETYR
jgi:hypothetical protein